MFGCYLVVCDVNGVVVVFVLNSAGACVRLFNNMFKLSYALFLYYYFFSSKCSSGYMFRGDDNIVPTSLTDFHRVKRLLIFVVGQRSLVGCKQAQAYKFIGALQMSIQCVYR
jgi:hypothetical protein